MSNWVHNHLAIEGNDSDIIKLKNQLNTPSLKFTLSYKEETGLGGEVTNSRKRVV